MLVRKEVVDERENGVFDFSWIFCCTDKNGGFLKRKDDKGLRVCGMCCRMCFEVGWR